MLLFYMAFIRENPLQLSKNSKGVKRRFEIVFEENDKIVIDDFAHHPTAILNTVQAAVSHFS